MTKITEVHLPNVSRIGNIHDVMKKSLRPRLTSLPLNHLTNLVSRHLGKNAHLSKSLGRDVLNDVAEGDLLDDGQGLKRLKNRLRKGEVNAGFDLTFSHNEATESKTVATLPEENEKKCARNVNAVDTWPQTVHKSSMPTKKAKTSKTDAWEGNRQRFYMLGPQFAVFAKACELKGKSVSEVLQSKAKAYVREHAPVLHKAGVKIPEEIFSK